MLSSPPDVLLKEEGTTAASVAFPPQGCWFFPHPPVSLHGHLYIWHCPSETTQSCHHCLAEHPVDLVRGWLWCMVSPRDPSDLFAPLELIFIFPHAPMPKDGAASWWPYWDARIASQSPAMGSPQEGGCGFFIQRSDWMLLYLLSFHHLWHGQSFPEYYFFRHWESGLWFSTGLYVSARAGLSFAYWLG